MMSYDLVFVVGYFRSATPFLSAICEFGKDKKVGVIFAELSDSMAGKTGNTHNLFVELCERFGADIIGVDQRIKAQLLIIQQYPYADSFVSLIKDRVVSNHTVGALTLASAGLDVHDKFIRQLDIKTVYALDSGLVRFLVGKRAAESQYQKLEIREVGLPFKKYAVFPEFSCDWLLLAPTLLSFKNEAGKKQFLSTVLKVLCQIPDGDSVFYKEHNGNEKDYFAPRFYYQIAWFMSRFPRSELFLEGVGRISPKIISRKLDRLIASLLYIRIFRRAKSLHRVTKYAGISVEAFLPGVKKGVIGGLSNVMWGTQYFDLPFYNCVDPEMRKGTVELKSGADKLLDLNVEYFGYSFCNGDLKSPEAYRPWRSRIDGTDLIQSLRMDMEADVNAG